MNKIVDWWQWYEISLNVPEISSRFPCPLGLCFGNPFYDWDPTSNKSRDNCSNDVFHCECSSWMEGLVHLEVGEVHCVQRWCFFRSVTQCWCLFRLIHLVQCQGSQVLMAGNVLACSYLEWCHHCKRSCPHCLWRCFELWSSNELPPT